MLQVVIPRHFSVSENLTIYTASHIAYVRAESVCEGDLAFKQSFVRCSMAARH